MTFPIGFGTRQFAVTVCATSCMARLVLAQPTPLSEPADADSKTTSRDQGVYPGCPPPVLPAAALFLAPYSKMELKISAGRDGTVQKVVISKRSRARLYDEYTRKWVEKHWKMPTAREGEPEVRTFIAPIVFPQASNFPEDFHCPPPPYPRADLLSHTEGLVILEIKVASSGKVEAARTLLSSGHRGLDENSIEWVKKKWKFPAGESRIYEWPVAYMMQ